MFEIRTYRSTSLVLALAISALVGCADEQSTAPATTPAASGSASAQPAASTASTPAATSTAVTGIAECDDFLNAYRQCVTANVPAASRAALQSGLDQWSASWKQMADNPATRDALPQVCAQARSATQASVQAYGCSL